MLSAHSASRAAFFAALFASSAPLVGAFSPIFGVPRQCGSLKITWSSSPISDTDVSSLAMTDIPVSLVPLDNDPSRFAPEPYTIALPFHPDHSGGEYEINVLPFPAGTQFFASAHVPGAGGFVKRVVSTVLTVEESVDNSCLPHAQMKAQAHAQSQGRSRSKGFGKRQVNVIGATQVDANAVPSGDATSTSATASASGVAINVIGVNVIPAGEAGASDTTTAGITESTGVTSASATETDSRTTLTVASDLGAPTGTSTGVAPAISVIGVNEIPASGAVSGTETVAATTTSGFVSAPINAAQSSGAAAPSSTGAVPVVQVIGVSFIPADGADPVADGSNLAASGQSLESGSEATSTEAASTEAASTEATFTETASPETVTETPYTDSGEYTGVEEGYQYGNSEGEYEDDSAVEEGCDDSQQSEENNYEGNQNNSSPYNYNSGAYSQHHGSSGGSNEYSGSRGNGRHGGSRHGSYNRYGQSNY